MAAEPKPRWILSRGPIGHQYEIEVEGPPLTAGTVEVCPVSELEEAEQERDAAQQGGGEGE